MSVIQTQKKIFDLKELKKMSLPFQRSVAESFKFNSRNIRTVRVPGLGKCSVGIDVSRAIGYEDGNNGRRTTKRHIPEEHKIQLGGVETDTTQPDMILLTEQGLKLFLMRCRKPRASDVVKHFGIKIEHCLLASKEQDVLSQIMQAFRGEEVIHQFGAGKYRIDLYSPKYKLAIECDELDHRDRDLNMKLDVKNTLKSYSAAPL